jgi:hypothetical protein
MKHSSLLPSLFGVTLLGLVHLDRQGGSQPGERPFTDLVAAAALLVGSGVVFMPLMKKEEQVPPDVLQAPDDDLDLSA